MAGKQLRPFLLQRQRLPNGKTLTDIKVGSPAEPSKGNRGVVKTSRRDSDMGQGFVAPGHLSRTSSTLDLDSGKVDSHRP
jgi:hypothetical protein